MRYLTILLIAYLYAVSIANAQNMIGTTENLGPGINSACWDYRPKISPDGSTLYFTRIGCPREIYNTYENLVMIAETDSTGQWQAARIWDAPFNTFDRNPYVYSISPDNNSLLLTLVAPNTGNRQLCEVYRTASGWSEPQVIDLGFPLPKYNSTFCLSNSGKVLIFSFEGNDQTGRGMGDKDLYISFRQADGKWSVAKNLGEIVNSPTLELGPFLASDDATLYFSSGRSDNNHGSNDLYMTRRLDDSWTNWSEPVNLGDGLNDDGWNDAFFIPAVGDYAYTNSEINTMGAGDIFRVKIMQAIKPMETILIEGKVVDSNGAPLEAIIKYQFLADGADAGFARTNPTSGVYKIVLPKGKQYSMYAESKGYYSVSEMLDLCTANLATKINRNITLKLLQVGQNILLNNLFFETNSATLMPESETELKRLADLLKSSPNIKIQILGYTDSDGDDSYNLKLSDQRALSVLNYLVKMEISATRLSKAGMGEKNPVADNNTPEGKKANRRVEFLIKEF